MARKPRLDVLGIPQHVVQRGNNREPVFFAERDYRAYLRWLDVGAKHYGLEIHAYVLMTNHVHLLVTQQRHKAISRTMQHLGRYYVPYVNRTYRRTGTLWEGRHKASLVDSESYILNCHRYIELNPVRAGLVERPDAYPWSSYHANALGDGCELLTPHREVLGLANCDAERHKVYRSLFNHALSTKTLDEIRQSLERNHVLGDERFRAKVERMLNRRIGTGRRGRPRKDSE